jgi:zinc D-Ala-D-Ala carboxypeptidase
MRLSKDFSLDEFVISQAATRMGFPNTPTPLIIDELHRLCTVILQPLRNALGVPVIISSGYRSPTLNKAIGGVMNSAHMYGRAADLIVPGMQPRHVCRRIVDLGIPFDQLIEEFGAWTHVATPVLGDAPRRQQLTARVVGGKSVYKEEPI